jgi:hypothetical protein
MTDDDWLAAGYKKYSPSRFSHEASDYTLQKRFDDQRGKRYYITVACYDRSRYPQPPHNVGVGYMPTAQFVLGDNLPFFDVRMNGIDDWGGGIEGVEAWFERLWVLFHRPYYEKWEDA